MMMPLFILLLQLVCWIPLAVGQSDSSDGLVALRSTGTQIDSIPLLHETITTKNTGREGKRRQLQLFGGVIDQRCEQIFDNTIENIFGRPDCSCEPVGLPPALVVDCQRSKESCIIKRRFTDDPNDKLLCGNPGLRVTLNVWSIVFGGSPVTAEICLYDPIAFNITLPDIVNPVCFGLFTGLPGSVPLANIFDLIFGRTASTAKLLGDQSNSSLKGNKSTMSLQKSSCVPTIGENKETCSSCSICPPEKGGGMIFDCSNIVPDLRFTECTTFLPFN